MFAAKLVRTAKPLRFMFPNLDLGVNLPPLRFSHIKLSPLRKRQLALSLWHLTIGESPWIWNLALTNWRSGTKFAPL
jgi:hypothetical protein